MDADQLTLELDKDASRRSMERLVVHSSLPRMERFDALPDGWKLDSSWGSPEHGWKPICNGKSLLNGGRKGLLKVKKPTVKESLTVAPPSLHAEMESERAELTEAERKIAAKVTNDLARAKFKEKLLQELMVDLMVCKIEGWSITEYISDLKTLIDETASSILHNGGYGNRSGNDNATKERIWFSPHCLHPDGNLELF
jgi:hypothetical protein